MATPTSIEVLASELNGLSKEVAELKGQFNSFSNNFMRNDIYSVRHNELTGRVAILEQKTKILWTQNIFWSVLGGVLVFLINYAMTH